MSRLRNVLSVALREVVLRNSEHPKNKLVFLKQCLPESVLTNTLYISQVNYLVMSLRDRVIQGGWILVLVTAASREETKKIARKLVGSRLAA